MPAVEALAGIGLAASEIFSYNRQNYEFDQDQRFEREELRIKLQVERFSLFREDIRDLVELTVSKMDLYNMIGALYIKQIVIYYSEGFIEEAPPPFLLTFYYMSLAISAVYLIMSIWLSVHASIVSHSYGTRLLTRVVRLPIPGSSQLNVLNARFADYERQGSQMFRVPFLKSNANSWESRAKIEGSRENKGSSKVVGDFLGSGEFAYGGGDNLLGHEEGLFHEGGQDQRHVKEFREAQANWQCHDAYSRVCMALGVREMLQAISYYLIEICCVQTPNMFVAYILVFVFQALSFSVCILDIHGINDLSFVGAIPSLLACLQMSFAVRQYGELDEDQNYIFSLAMYPIEVCWFELLHWLASPSDKDGSLPRLFRSVLFMDVFSDLDGVTLAMSEDHRELVTERAEQAESTLHDLQSALRRWQAVPSSWMNMKQRRTRADLIKKFEKLADGFVTLLDQASLPQPKEDARQWEELTVSEQQNDRFTGRVLGPFAHWTGLPLSKEYYWDIEAGEQGRIQNLPQGCRALTLRDVTNLLLVWKDQLKDFEHACLEENFVAASTPAAAKAVSEGSSSDDGEASHLDGKSSRGHDSGSDSRSPRPSKEDSVKAQRLPWKLVSFLTRVVQIVWIAQGVFAILRFTNVEVFDYQVVSIVERRLSSQTGDLQFEELDLAWPFGTFFRVQDVACGMPSIADTDSSGLGALVIGSPFAQYSLSNFSSAFADSSSNSSKVQVKELLSSAFPAGGKLFCETSGVPCWVADTNQEGLVIRSQTQRITLRVRLPDNPLIHWKHLSGSIVDCGVAFGVMKHGDAQTSAQCVLVAGITDSSSAMTIGMATLPRDESATVLLATRQLDLRNHSSARTSVSATFLEGGRLWVLRGSSLEAWELLEAPARLAVRRGLRWQGRLAVRALCGYRQTGDLFLAGQKLVDGAPVLLRAQGQLESVNF